MKLFIIRHGDPDYEHDNLTARGKKEAELLSERLLSENITDVFCSPLGRAQATAVPFLEKTGLKSQTLDWLREFPKPILQPYRSYGLGDEDVRSCPWDLHPAIFNANINTFSDPQKWLEHPMYRDEGTSDAAERIRGELFSFLEQFGLIRQGCAFTMREGMTFDDIKDRNIAFFCHMGLGSLLTAYLGLIAPPVFWQTFRVMPTSVTTVLFYPSKDMIQSKIFMVGDVTHLAPLGLTYRG